MNIAFLQRRFSDKAIEAIKTTSIGLAKEFDKKGDKSVIITEGGYFFGEKTSRHEKIEGVDVYRPYFFPYPMKNPLRIIEIFNYFIAPPIGLNYVQNKNNYKFDVINSISSAPIMVLMGVFARLFSKNAKVVHSIRSESKYGFGFGWMLNLADKIVVPLEYIKHELVKRGCKPSKITVIRSPVDISKYKPLDKTKMKTKYGLKNKKVVLYYGGFIKDKGVDDLFKAIPSLVESDPEIEIHLVDRGRIKAKYMEMYDNLGKYKKNVKMFFKKLNVVEYLNAVDVLVLPYADSKRTDGNPLCLIEGMACKTPIVTTNLPGLREFLTPNEDVLMANPKDPESISKNIIRLLNDKRLQNKLTENAHKKVGQFDIKKVSEEYLRLYKKLLSD